MIKITGCPFNNTTIALSLVHIEVQILHARSKPKLKAIQLGGRYQKILFQQTLDKIPVLYIFSVLI